MQTVIITFALRGLDRAGFARLAEDSAGPIARVSGLIGKVYLVDEPSNTYGGVYFFVDRASAEAYLTSEIVDALRSHPNVAEITVGLYDTIEAATRITQRQLPLLAA